MFGKRFSSKGFKPQDFRPERKQKSSSGKSVQSSQTSSPRYQIDLDLLSLVEGVTRTFDLLERRRQRDQEINLDILGLAKICEGVISAPDVMIHLSLSRRQARARLERFLAHGYCRVIEEVQGEFLYLFEALLPEAQDCSYCSSRYKKHEAPQDCHNCGAPLR